ncbi:MAG: TorF family putative porin [Sphingobium sp.]
MRRLTGAACVAAACLSAVPALAQYDGGVRATVEAASEERRRGLSWSGGDPVLRATSSAPVGAGFGVEAAAATLRGGARHGGADAVVDLGGTYSQRIGGWRLSAEGRYHLFPGASGHGYGDIGAGAGFTIGPASIDMFASYAPRQRSIGGDNLYLAAYGAAGIPGTPLTLSAHVGRSSGAVRDPVRAARLRPEKVYWDHGIGIDYLRGRWFAGLRYADTDIETPGARHAGASLIGRAGLSF